MTKDDLIQAAVDAGFEVRCVNSIGGDEAFVEGVIVTDMLEDFATIVAGAERRRLAAICEKSDRYRGEYFAQLIRGEG